MIKVALFDVDGTLLNTYDSIFRAFKYSLKKYKNLDFTEKDFKKVMGKPLRECYRIITQLENVETLQNDHIIFQRNNIHLFTLYPKVKTTLALLKRKGIKIGFVSARGGNTLSESLRLSQLDKYANVVIDGDSVTEHKPHPEPLLKALKILNEKPQNAIMIGDLEADILAGKNAGTRTIGVTYGFIGKKIAQANPDYTIDNIDELLSLPFLK